MWIIKTAVRRQAPRQMHSMGCKEIPAETDTATGFSTGCPTVNPSPVLHPTSGEEQKRKGKINSKAIGKQEKEQDKQAMEEGYCIFIRNVSCLPR